MGAQKGKDLLVRVDLTGEGAFETVAGLRARSIRFEAATVDVTDSESAGRWRELLAGAGAKRAAIAGTGIFKDVASDAAVRTLFFEGTVRAWRFAVPDFGTIFGPFQITELSYAGEQDGEVTFEIALESAGQLGFTAE